MQPEHARAGGAKAKVPATKVPASTGAAKFFQRLADAGHVATFEGHPPVTLRFDLIDGAVTDRWHLAVRNGDVTISHRGGQADAVARLERRHFEAIAAGKMNAQAAMLRGLLACQGSVAAVMMFQRCLPGPPGSTGRVAPISGATVTAENSRRGDRA